MASACSVVMANDSSMMGVADAGTGRSALHTRASTCILVTLSLVSALVLVVCGVLVVRDWAISRTFEATECTMRNVTYVGQDRDCVYCTSGAKDGKGRLEKGSGGSSYAGGGSTCVPSYYPCLNVIVSYGPNNSSRRRAILYESSIQATGIHRDCSISICHRTRDENAKAVEDFAEKWRLKSTPFRCFYDTTDVQRVIVRKNYTTVDVIHCMLWPSLVIIISITIFLKLESKRRGLTFCGRIEPEEEKTGKTISADAKNLVNRKNLGANKSNKTSDNVILFDKLNESIPENISKDSHSKLSSEGAPANKTFQSQGNSQIANDSSGSHPTPKHRSHYLTGRPAHDQHRHAMQKIHKHSNPQSGKSSTSKSLTNLNSICVRYVNPEKNGNNKDGYKQMLEKSLYSTDRINEEGIISIKDRSLIAQTNSESPLICNYRSSSMDWIEEATSKKNERIMDGACK